MYSDVAGEVRDIEYRRVGEKILLGRLYRPSGKCVALMIDVHGGGWTSGDRTNNALISRALMKEGIAVFAIDFRMPPEASFPAALEDVNFAIRWLKRNAVELGIESLAFGGIGTSSGGHLLLENVLRLDDYAPVDMVLKQQLVQFDFIVACWPVADPLARYRMAKKKGLENLIKAHQAFWPDEKAMEIANPQLVLDRHEAKNLPPLLLLQGTDDENVEFHRSDVFATSYRSLGGQADVRMYPGARHAFITRDPESRAAGEALAALTSFVKTQAASRADASK